VSIDATFVTKGGEAQVEATKRGKGMRISDCGSPWTAALGQYACRQPSRSPAALLRLLHVEVKPENLIGDRAYDSDPLDEELRRDGIEMIAPHRSNRRRHRDDRAAPLQSKTASR
jgi:hypothetical protein